MKILVIIVILLLITAVSVVLYLKYRLNHTVDRKDLETSIDLEIKKITHAEITKRLVIGVYKDGKTFIKGYGRANNDNDNQTASTAVFQIGSMSKLFTASLLQILCDEGIVSMDSTLGQLIGNTIPLSNAAQQVTLLQLVTHTSGFPRVPKQLLQRATQLAGKDNILVNPYNQVTPEDIFNYLNTTPDKRKPGHFEYSNFGMGLVGHVLEIVTSKRFESLVTDNLLTPLDMRSTAITLTSSMNDQLVPGYTSKGIPAPLWTFRVLAGAGAFNSNAEDLLKFIKANINDTSRLTKSLKKMHQPYLSGRSGTGWMLPTFIDKFVGNKSIVWHNGMVGGYASYLSIDNSNNTGIVILSNSAIDITMTGIMLTRLIRTQSWSR